MAALVLSCLSQKGGVGKSTIARLLATAYAAHGQRTAIFDFNGAQETSRLWGEIRDRHGIEPRVHVELATQANRMRGDGRFDMIVADGRPDGAEVTLSIARASDLVVIPTGFTVDDLVPQRRFALELENQGVPRKRILFVINRVLDHRELTEDAMTFLGDFDVVSTALPYRTAYVRCHIAGYSVGEVKAAVMGNMDGLARAAARVAGDIARRAMELT